VPSTAQVSIALTLFAACTCVLGLALLAWAWRDACAAYALVLIGFPAWGLGAVAALIAMISDRGPTRWRTTAGWLLLAQCRVRRPELDVAVESLLLSR
jgi:hypothetical protein